MIPLLPPNILSPCCFHSIQEACPPLLLENPSASFTQRSSSHRLLDAGGPEGLVSAVSPTLSLPDSCPLSTDDSQHLYHSNQTGLSSRPLSPGLLISQLRSLRLNLLQM